MSRLTGLQKAIRVTFKDISLLEQALIHSSYVNENPDITSVPNERLEFLGDAVLALVIAEKLYQDFPEFDEGQMTKLRAAVIRKDTLVRVAKSINLGEYLSLGKGEEKSGGHQKPTNLACGMEAVIAAIFMDRGWSTTRKIVLQLFESELQSAINLDTVIDNKSELQELIQAKYQQVPSYHVVGTAGPNHSKIFTVEVRLGKKTLGKGSGTSKKAAESQAARSALKNIPSGFTA